MAGLCHRYTTHSAAALAYDLITIFAGGL